MTGDAAREQSIILASASPRRRELLADLGVPFEVVVSDACEPVRQPDEPCAHYALRMALVKARAVAETHPDRWILGADTIVVIDDVVLGKPSDTEHAREMLHSLSGREHQVHTAIALIRHDRPAQRQEHTAVDTTRVTFRHLTRAEIEQYVAGGEPLDKAGAYGIQGDGGALVETFRGSYTNVVGLPVELVAAMLRQHTQTPITENSLDGLRAAERRWS